jgi:hypothetical protein
LCFCSSAAAQERCRSWLTPAALAQKQEQSKAKVNKDSWSKFGFKIIEIIDNNEVLLNNNFG